MTRTQHMPAEKARKPLGPAGFTLIELLVSLTLLSLVMGAAFAVMTSSQDSQERGCQAADARQNLRSAFEVMARDIRAAGSGIGTAPVSASYDGEAFLIHGVDPDTLSPRFTLAGVMDSTVTTLRHRMKRSTSYLRCRDVSRFSIGDLVVVTDDVTAHLFQVTDIVASQTQLKNQTTSPYNPSSGFPDWPPSGYAEDSRVQKIEIITYFLDEDQQSLMRETPGAGASYVSGGITAFDIDYHLSGGEITRSPADPAEIIAIQMTMTAQSDRLRSGDPVEQVLTTTIMPRCLGR